MAPSEGRRPRRKNLTRAPKIPRCAWNHTISCRRKGSAPIEVDGGVHRETRERDDARDAELARVYGVRVLRVDAGLVERDAETALAVIRGAL